MDTTHYGHVYMCALDFCRALRERGKLLNWLFKIIIGRYAYKEYVIMRTVINHDGYNTNFEYDCESCDYQNKSIKQIEAEWNETTHQATR